MQTVILCSASPRRRELLGEIFDRFEIKAGSGEEKSSFVRPHKKVVDLALGKQAGVPVPKGGVVISADTLVYKSGKYYGKPGSPFAAKEMLLELSGKTHYVYTGVAIRTEEKTVAFYERSGVRMKRLSEEEIDRYIRDFSPLDKAGAYGIQDGVIVQGFSGSYSNVVGLPVERLKEELKKMGVQYDR